MFNKSKIEFDNAANKKQYENDLEFYNKSLKAYEKDVVAFEEKIEAVKNEKIQKYNDSIADMQKQVDDCKDEIETYLKPSKSNAVVKLFNDELNTAKKMIKKMAECRAKLYSFGVIYSKYCSIMPVLSFLEYLKSGRCSSLAGVGGAYNLFEQEQSSKQILSKLDNIIEDLQDIKNSQQYIKDAIIVANEELSALNNKCHGLMNSLGKMQNTLSDINSNTYVLAKNSEYVAYNTFVTSYYAKKNAEISDAIGLMMALK